MASVSTVTVDLFFGVILTVFKWVFIWGSTAGVNHPNPKSESSNRVIENCMSRDDQRRRTSSPAEHAPEA